MFENCIFCRLSTLTPQEKITGSNIEMPAPTPSYIPSDNEVIEKYKFFQPNVNLLIPLLIIIYNR
jgi:hypothetical protein